MGDDLSVFSGGVVTVVGVTLLATVVGVVEVVGVPLSPTVVSVNITVFSVKQYCILYNITLLAVLPLTSL